jgi:8-oxo-dGTP pyrophosphatase MutT (NUDIX family)
MKKRGFGHGRFNGLCSLLFSVIAFHSLDPYSSAARVGFGGKVEKGETVLEGAHRELEEEAFVTTHNLDRVGMLLFTFANDPIALEVHVYSTVSYSGDPKEFVCFILGR